MREDITSLPVSEVFEPRDGCPVCRMRDMLEQRITDYITGAAMMEPDVRIETNEQGFCFPHYQMLLKKRNRLGVALMLESRLEEVEKQVYDAAASPFGFNAKKQRTSRCTAALCAARWTGQWSVCFRPFAACGSVRRISGSCFPNNLTCASPTSPSFPQRRWPTWEGKTPLPLSARPRTSAGIT